jgi:CRP-like cAMP-binding protein
MTIRDQSLDVLKDHLERKISLTPAEFDFLTSLLKSKSLKKDECLIRPGEICKYESFVTRGCLKSFYEDDRGTVHIVDFCVEGWWADDLYSFFTQTPSRSTIIPRRSPPSSLRAHAQNSIPLLASCDDSLGFLG